MPSPAAALRVNIPPMRMYLANISVDLWPVWRMMSRLLTPFMAAWATRGNDPANVSGYKRGLRLMREFVAVMSLLICLFCSVSFAIGSCLLRLVRGVQAHVGQDTF